MHINPASLGASARVYGGVGSATPGTSHLEISRAKSCIDRRRRDYLMPRQQVSRHLRDDSYVGTTHDVSGSWKSRDFSHGLCCRSSEGFQTMRIRICLWAHEYSNRAFWELNNTTTEYKYFYSSMCYLANQITLYILPRLVMFRLEIQPIWG